MIFWLGIMTFIWLFLLGWRSPVSGTFNPTEIAMTVVVGVAAMVGLTACFRWRTPVGWGAAIAVFVLLAVFQVAAMAISLTPYVATR
jgi:hypothetical protein